MRENRIDNDNVAIITQNRAIRKIDGQIASCYNAGMKTDNNGKTLLKAKLRQWFSWAHVKEVIRKCVRVILNPKLFLCLLIAWMITNGWSYVFVGLGMWLKIDWMLTVGAAYLSFLWIPFTPEKLLTVIIAMILMKLFFPNDERTLGVLRQWRNQLRIKRKQKRERAEH